MLKKKHNQTIISEERRPSMLPEELYYTEDHEWVKIDNNIAIIGITEHAADELGEIVYVELPKPNLELSQSDELGSVESVKTVSSLFSPVSGKVIESNTDLEAAPDTINDSPYENGWLVKLQASDLQEVEDLMNYEDYKTFLTTQ